MNKLELLVSFFKNSLQSLSPKPGSSIIVTLFEGEPYTLWNIRDLGRHSGLEVKRSWKFQASAYPGYRHARTLGVVKGKNGEIGGGWKGEERTARSYEFVRKVGKKRKESSDDEDENEDMEDDETLQEDEEEEQWEGLDGEDIHEEESGTENEDEDGD
jgi:25S rRNA (uracil2634-N3)-methyltransferase